MRTAFDLLILAALSKELLGAVERGVLPFNLFLLGMLAIPFFLGMAGETKAGAVEWNPVRSVTRTGVAVLSLVLYLQLQALQGIAWMFSGIFLASLLVYGLGRLAGMASRSLWVLAALLGVAYALSLLAKHS